MNADRAVPRLDEWLVKDLVGPRPHLRPVIDEVHDLCDFFARAAAAPFAAPAPTELGKKGAPAALISGVRLRLFHRLLTLRTAALLFDAVPALNESRLVTFALASRGVLETAALAAYHAPSVAIAPGATTIPSDYDQYLRAAVMSGRFDWLRFLSNHAARLELIDAYAADPKKQLPPDEAKNVSTMIEHLVRRVQKHHEKGRGMVLLDYAMLSDLSHPAVGSHFVFMTGVDPELRADLVPPRTTLLGLAELLIPCLAYSAQAVVEVLAELEESLERLSKMPT